MKNKPAYISKNDRLLVIIGPSGVGKSTLVQQLQKEGIIEVTPTWTDRPKRKNEQDSVEHVFVSTQELEQKQKNGFFLDEARRMFDLKYIYALPKINNPGKNVIPAVMMRSSVLSLLKKHHYKLVIYQIEAPKERVIEQLEERAKFGSEIGSRIKDIDEEILQGRKYAKRIFINENFKKTLRDIRSSLTLDFYN